MKSPSRPLQLDETMKPCIRCNQVKPLTDFYAHSRMGDGHLNKCKDWLIADSAGRTRV